MSGSRSAHPSWAMRFNAYLPGFMRSSVPAEAEEVPTPVVRTSTHYSILSNLRGAAWDGSAMFLGTLAWMAVYYAKDLFAKLDDDGAGSYFLHCLAMGIAANLAVLPLVRQKHLSKGKTHKQTYTEIKKYFIVCTIPDALYEPTADWLAAMATADSFTDFDFVKYAQPTFNAKEAAGAFVFFGVVFGMIYYGGDKFIQYLSPDEKSLPEQNLSPDASLSHKSLRKLRDIAESDEFDAVMAGLQYFIFYLADDICDVDWVSFEITIPILFMVCSVMGGYTFAVDAVQVLLKALENKLYPDADAARRSSIASLSAIYDDNDLREPLIPASVTPMAANGRNFWNEKNDRLMLASSSYIAADGQRLSPV